MILKVLPNPNHSMVLFLCLPVTKRHVAAGRRRSASKPKSRAGFGFSSFYFFFDGWVAALEGTCLLWGKVLTPKSL